MGFTKKLKLEQFEEQYAEHLRELKAEADEEFPGEDWDPEVYEAYRQAMEKDD